MNIMKSIYEGSESFVRISQGQTDIFSVDSGVRQGDFLPPLLLSILLHYVMRKVVVAWSGV